MGLRADRDWASFGWSVGCAGRKPVQVRDEVRAMVDWASAVWSSAFPEEHGYRVAVASPAGPSNGVQLLVTRGDFRASMSIESIRAPGQRYGSQLGVRMFGRAESGVLSEVERAGIRVVQRGRNIGLGFGVAAFAMLCWWSIGVSNPVFVLGGLLMVVAALLTTTAGGTLGAWLGERIAEQSRMRARNDVAHDHRLEQDMRRWRSLARQFSAQRHVLSGQGLGAAPFRSLAAGPSAPGGRSLRLATSSSFSS